MAGVWLRVACSGSLFSRYQCGIARAEPGDDRELMLVGCGLEISGVPTSALHRGRRIGVRQDEQVGCCLPVVAC